MNLTLEKTKKEIENFDIHQGFEEMTEGEEQKYDTLKRLSFKNTPEFKKLKKKKELDELSLEHKRFLPTIKKHEKNGFKILTKNFIDNFLEKYNLTINKSITYIYDIPEENLLNINQKINKFLDFHVENIEDEVKFLRYSDYSYPSYEYEGPSHINFDIKKDVRPSINIQDVLYIIAPKEHFDSSLEPVDLDPIALLKIENNYYLYLDAWDLEKYLLDI